MIRNVPNLSHRLYRTSDLEGLRDLWRRVYHADSVPRREAAFVWITEQNPYRTAAPNRHLIWDNDKERVAGTLGSLSLRYCFHDKTFDMSYSHDLLVDPGYRGLGLGKKLVDAVAQGASGLAGGLWMTDACYALHQRMNWTPVRPFKAQRLVLDAKAAFRRRTRSRAISGLAGGVAQIWSTHVQRKLRRIPAQATVLSHFDGSVDELFERARPDLGIAALRHQQYLNWKYVESPNSRYRILLIADNGRADAYAVTRLDEKENAKNGLIVDLLADPNKPKAFAAAVVAAVKHLSQEGAEIIYVLTTYPPFRSQLQTMGFHLSSRPFTFVVTGHEPVVGGRDLTDPSSWYLTLGDSDGDMWANAQTWTLDRQAVRAR